MSFYASTFARVGGGRWHYPDLMHEGAVREFVRNTYEPYARRFQKDFGKAIPGVFTDEPLLKGELPWSLPLPATFRRRRGYDLLQKLPHLVFLTAESPKVRHDYWQTVCELFSGNFMARLGQWCGQHGLAFTGHLMAEGSLGSQIRVSGGSMPHYVHMQAPGIDILCEQTEEILTVKQCASVANQFGRERVLSELYGATGYNFSFEAQKWVGDWQMALGVNLLCQHLTHYTMKGQAKRDYPPSYFYQSPWWRHYRSIADYQARLTYVLRQGRPVRDILLLHPLTSGWTLMGANATTHGVGDIDQSFRRLMQDLLDLHRDFDLGDETLMAAHGRVKGDRFVVGQVAYKTVIVPGMVNIESSTLNLLVRFRKAGGRLLFVYPIPIRVDGELSDRPAELAASEGVRRVSRHARELEEALGSVLPRTLSVVNRDTGAEAAGVVAMERQNGKETILFLVNTRRDVSLPLQVRLPGQGSWRRWDCESGAVRPFPSVRKDTGSVLDLTLPPVGSVVLVRNPGRPAAIPAPARRVAEQLLAPHGGWSFRRLAPNSLILDRCTWRIGDEPFSQPTFLWSAQREWIKRLNIQAYGQPWKLLKDPANHKVAATVTLRFPFIVETLPSGGTQLVLEDRADTGIFVNGQSVEASSNGWFMDKAFETVPIQRCLRRGENIVEIRVPVSVVRSVEEMYVIGDFGVDSRTFALVKEPKRLVVGDWCPQGYPFYTDAMLYQRMFRVPGKRAGRTIVEFGRFDGAVAAVWVNGQKTAVMGWHPYRADVTEFVRAGTNELGLEIVGSPRNLMGPRHHKQKYPGWTGPGELADMSQPAYHLTPAGLMGDVRIVLHTETAKRHRRRQGTKD
jgi:hypothetical protein